jgi:HSP20 family molecular chaperone IbpA
LQLSRPPLPRWGRPSAILTEIRLRPPLTIRGEKRPEAEEKSERVHRHERSYGKRARPREIPVQVS